MSRLLIIIAVLLVAAAPVQALDFKQLVDPAHPETHGHGEGESDPHRGTFAGSTCAQCHACEKPTLEDPCLVHCPRHGGHFYGEHAADDGPDVIVIDQLANLYRPVVFAHKLHAGMAEMGGGCTHCHHYSEESGEIPPCRSCHEENRLEADLRMPALKGAYHRQCMNCHRDWSHENACGFCHEEAGGDPVDTAHDPTDIVGVRHPLIEATETYTYETTYKDGPVVTFHHSDHVDLFGQQCVDCHRGDSCARCHETEKKPAAHLNHLTSCCSCHGKRDCGFCHAETVKPKFEHTTSTGWDLAPYHEDVACTVCHGQPGNFHTPVTRCDDCHIHWEVGSFDHAVTRLTLNEDHVDIDCGDCHLDMDFENTPNCENCHDEPMLPEQLPGKLKLH